MLMAPRRIRGSSAPLGSPQPHGSSVSKLDLLGALLGIAKQCWMWPVSFCPVGTTRRGMGTATFGQQTKALVQKSWSVSPLHAAPGPQFPELCSWLPCLRVSAGKEALCVPCAARRTYQKRNMGSNICLCVAPIFFCVILAVIQGVVNVIFLNSGEQRSGTRAAGPPCQAGGPRK